MPPQKISATHFSEDIREFIASLNQHEVRYVIVGGEAVILYGFPRLTGDVDFFYEATPENAQKLFAAILTFWGGEAPGVLSWRELLEPGIVIQFGRPPNRIVLLSSIDAVAFEEAFTSRQLVELPVAQGRSEVLPYLTAELLIRNKRATGRLKDLQDLQFLPANLPI